MGNDGHRIICEECLGQTEECGVVILCVDCAGNKLWFQEIDLNGALHVTEGEECL